MGHADWDAPRTEEGLQRVLLQLDECRVAGDLIETGNGLLALSFLVKWVRSDTEQPPFDRSHELALQALEAFRLACHMQGQVRALVAASALANVADREKMLLEAESSAQSSGDENLIASVLSAKARGFAMSNKQQAKVLQREALDIYRKTGHVQGQARSLMTLSLGEGDSAEKRDYAIEAAQLYRQSDNHQDASRCVWIAFMNAEEVQPIEELEGLVREGLADALEAADRNGELLFYDKLAMIAIANGNADEASKYHRWAKDLEESDGLSPIERWKNNIEMAKTMIALTKVQGNKEATKIFQESLRELRASKPRKQ